MTRDEVILAIESVDHSNDQALKALDEQLRQRVIADQAVRTSWAIDFERGVVYCLVLISGMYYLNKMNRQYLRPNLRSVVFGIVVSVTVAVEAIFLAAVALSLPNQAYGFAGVMFVFLFEFSVFMWFMDRVRRKNLVSDLGMHAYCIKCKYNLAGLQQALGDQLVVGPEICPECGCSYPAVG